MTSSIDFNLFRRVIIHCCNQKFVACDSSSIHDDRSDSIHASLRPGILDDNKSTISCVDAVNRDADQTDKSNLQKIWMCGSRFSIPNGHMFDILRPIPISWFDRFRTLSGDLVQWKSISFGICCGAALSSSGEAFVWGYLPKWVLNSGVNEIVSNIEDDTNVKTFDREEGTFVEPFQLGLSNIVDIKFSEGCMFVLTGEGRVFCQATSDLLLDLHINEIGVHNIKRGFVEVRLFEETKSIEGNTTGIRKTQKVIHDDKNKRIVKFSIGDDHALFMDDKGILYSLGDNSRGQCGSGKPREYVSGAETESVVFHSRPDSNTYICRGPSRRSLINLIESARNGTTDNQRETKSVGIIYAQQTTLPVTVKDLACGRNHSLILCINGSVWVFGADDNIQLGLGDTRFSASPFDSRNFPGTFGTERFREKNDSYVDPRRGLDGNRKPIGYGFYEQHSQFIPRMIGPPISDNNLLRRYKDPISVECCGDASLMVHETVVPIKTTNTSIDGITSNKDPYSGTVVICCGDNFFGQGGRGRQRQHQTRLPVKLPDSAYCKEISCGSNHCMALMNDHRLFVWGCNEKGQLGVGHRAAVSPPISIFRSNLRGPHRTDIRAINSSKQFTPYKHHLFPFVNSPINDNPKTVSEIDILMDERIRRNKRWRFQPSLDLPPLISDIPLAPDKSPWIHLVSLPWTSRIFSTRKGNSISPSGVGSHPSPSISVDIMSKNEQLKWNVSHITAGYENSAFIGTNNANPNGKIGGRTI